MKCATAFRAQKIWISSVLVSNHLRVMTWAEGMKIIPEREVGHCETLP